MVGAIIGAALSAAGSIYGATQSAKANKEAQAKLAQMKSDNQSWYDKEYYADPTQRADAQRAINMVSQQLKERNKAIQGAAAVGGATDEAVAQQKAAGTQALADTVGQIAAAGQAHKDNVQQQYMSNKQALDQQQIANDQQRANNIASAVSSMGQVAGSMVAQDNLLGKGTETYSPTVSTGIQSATPNISGLQTMARTGQTATNALGQTAVQETADAFRKTPKLNGPLNGK